MGYIAQMAGGGAHDGKVNILDKVPSSVHERTPVYVGSRNLLEIAKKKEEA